MLALTDLKIAPVRPNRHRSAAVRPKHGNVPGAESREDFARRVPVAIEPHTDDGYPRADGIEPFCRCPASRAVMPQLEYVGATYASDEHRLCRPANISGQEGAEAAIG